MIFIADGTLKFDTKIDDGGFVEGIQKMSSKQIRLQNAIKKTRDEMTRLENAMKGMADAKVPTQEYQEIQKQIEDARRKLNGYLETEQRMKDTGASQKGQAWKNLQWNIENARNTLNAAKEDMKNLDESGGAFTVGGDPAKLADMQSKYDILKGKLNEYNAALAETSAKENQEATSSSRVARVLGSLASAASKTWSGMKRLGSIAGSIGKSFGKLALTAGKAAGKMISQFGKLGNVFSRGQKNANGFGMSISRVLKSVVLYQGIRKIFKALTDTLWSAMRTNNEFISNLSKVKGNLYTAFQPIFEAVMPAINALMGGIIKATGYLAQFTSALFGKSAKASQEAAKAQYDQAQALDETGKAAKGANKQLSSIDKLNTVGDDNEAGASGNDIKPNFNYEIELSDEVESFSDKLKKAWLEADFTEIGEIIAGKINSAVDKIDWNHAQQQGEKIAEVIYTGINGFVNEVDWKNIGDGIGNGINMAVSLAEKFLNGVEWDKIGAGVGNMLQSSIDKINWIKIGETVSSGINAVTKYFNNFYESVDWIGLGSNIASSLNAAITNINWSEVGRSIANGLNIAILSLYGFVTTFDWTGLGNSIAESINSALINTDWIKLAQGVSSLAIGLLDTISSAIKGIDWRGIGNTIGEMLSNIDWLEVAKKILTLLVNAFNGLVSLIWGIGEKLGKNIAEGLSGGIKISDILKNTWKWLKDNVFTPIIDNFKKLFGIQSPSKVMADMGKYIMQGLANGITSLVSKVKEKFSKLLSDIKGFFTNLPTWFKDKFTSALNNIKSVFNISAIKTHFSSIWTNIKSCFSSVATWFKDTFTKAWTNVKNVFSTGGKIFDGIKEGIGDTFKSVVNKLIDGINAVISIPFNAINGMLNKIRDISILGISPFSGLWGRDPLGVPKIPKLATGTVVPKNYGEFLSILGDAREPEVVSPVSTMKQAFKEALAEMGGTGAGTINLNVYLSGKQIHTEIIKQDELYKDQTGRSAFAPA